jgi:hypothetical protein
MNSHFDDMTARAFGFLTEVGFQIAARSAHQVEFESRTTVVTVCWDQRSGELEVFFELLPRSGASASKYSLRDVMDAQGVRGYVSAPQVADETRLQRWLENIASAVRNHAQPALIGDRMFYRRVETFRHAQAVAYTQSIRLRKVRGAAENAWRERDLKTVVSLYASIEPELTDAERLKLDYAKKHQAD